MRSYFINSLTFFERLTKEFVTSLPLAVVPVRYALIFLILFEIIRVCSPNPEEPSELLSFNDDKIEVDLTIFVTSF